jgi:TonB-dependent starch-binding outer membrane protein SusC
MKRIFAFTLFLGMVYSLYAQDRTIQGTVGEVDSGESLPGVTVLIKGTTRGTITDIDGNYSIQANEGDVLSFSYVGYLTKEVPVDDATNIEVQLELDIAGLEEVVVIGYGTVRKEDLTGAVSVVNSEVISDLKPLKAEQALQGTVAGVNVTSQSGAPGAGLDIRIRGISTNGDASPLVIIDGYQGDMSLLNPNDIESITVLKDAQAAIYGTIGANGVILITTKKGTRNTPTKVSINSNYGIQETTKKLNLLNATEYAVLLNESYAASGEAIPYPDISGLGLGTNWQSTLFERAPITNNDISVSGGSDRFIYSLSASDLRQQGIIGADKTGFKRNTARLSMGGDLYEWLQFNSAIVYTYLNRKSINDFGLGSVLFNAINMPPTHPVFNEDNEYFLAPGNLGIEIINPMAQIANTYNDYNLSKLNGNFGLDAKFAKHFTATARIGFNTTNDRSKSFLKIVDYGGKVFDIARSSVSQGRNTYNDYTFDLYASYNNTFLDGHQVTVNMGTSVFKEWGNNLSGTGYDIPYNSWEFADIALADGIIESKPVGSFVYDQRRLSYFGRLQYDYQGKYLMSAMLRRDASTKFGPDNTFQFFPSVTLGWKASEESFMSDIDIINHLKLRMSYGLLGSDKIGNYRYISQLNGEGTYVLDGGLVFGKAVGVLPNSAVKWEESEQFDVGLDLRILNNRLTFTADYFIKNTNNLLLTTPVSGIYGIGGPGSGYPTVNAGAVRNSGIEMALGFRGLVGDDLSYGINYNFTYLHNEVTQVDNNNGYVEGGSFGVGQPLPARMEVGFPIGYYYGYVTDGIFQTQDEVDAHPSQALLGAEAVPGDIRFEDTDQDGDIDTEDRVYLGDPIPDFVMGLNLTVKYKGFDLVGYAYASIGNEIVRNYERTQPNVNRLAYTMDRWTGRETSTTVPRLTTAATSNNVFSDFYVEDGSYLRLQNLQLGYTLPATLTEKATMRDVRVYISATNLFTISKYMGFDAAASTGAPVGAGFDNGFYPAARIYTIGLNLNF